MPHILMLLDPDCSDLEEEVQAGLRARYGEEFLVVDPNTLISGDPEDLAPLVVCYFWILKARRKYTATVYVAVTRRQVEDHGLCTFILASIRRGKGILFILYPNGGGIMQSIEKPINTYPLKKENTLTMVWDTIEANDKEQFS